MERTRKLATATVLCVMVAGCGGSSATTAFSTAYLNASRPLQQTGADIARAILSASHRTDNQLATQFTGFADRFDSEIIQLEGLTPPASASAAFATVTAAANRFETDLRAIASSESRHDGFGARTGVQALVADGRAMSAGATTLRQKLGIK